MPIVKPLSPSPHVATEPPAYWGNYSTRVLASSTRALAVHSEPCIRIHRLAGWQKHTHTHRQRQPIGQLLPGCLREWSASNWFAETPRRH